MMDLYLIHLSKPIRGTISRVNPKVNMDLGNYDMPV